MYKVREKQSHENKRNDKDYKRFMACTFEPVLITQPTYEFSDDCATSKAP